MLVDVNITVDLSNASTQSVYSNLTGDEIPQKQVQTNGATLMMFTKTSVTVKFSIMVTMVICGVLGNSFMAFLIWRTPRLRSKTNILVASLVLTDIFACFTVTLFIAVYQFFIYVFSKNPCNYVVLVAISFPAGRIGGQAVAGIMISIAVDRYIAIVYPLHYEMKVSDSFAKRSIIISWIYAMVVCLINCLYMIKVDFSSCAAPYSLAMQCVFDNAVYGVVASVMLFVYGRICRVAIKQRSQIEAVTYNTSNDQQESDHAKTYRRELKAVKVTAMILGSYIILWFPYEVGRFLQATGNTERYTQVILDAGLAIGVFNYSFDWLIYGLSSKDFRDSIKRVLSRENLKDDK